MFYRPEIDSHGFPHNPFKACVVPRPIGWISTVSTEGVRNLAPFSFFNAVSWAPPMVVFGAPGRRTGGAGKDTLVNVEETGEFVVNMATYALREAVNRTSASLSADVDEFDVAGLESAPSELVRPSRVAASPIHLECRHHQTVTLPGRGEERSNALVIGLVVGVHINDDVVRDGRVDTASLRPLARLGYRDWAAIDAVFEQPSLSRITDPSALAKEVAGS